jgi:hypothetical protein
MFFEGMNEEKEKEAKEEKSPACLICRGPTH